MAIESIPEHCRNIFRTVVSTANARKILARIRLSMWVFKGGSPLSNDD